MFNMTSYPFFNSKKAFVILVIIFGLLTLSLNHLLTRETKDKEAKIIPPLIQRDIDFDAIFKDIFNASAGQHQIDREILLRTLVFQIEEVDEYDPKLVDFVRSIIVRLDRKYTGQVSIESERDDLRYVDTLLKSKRNGFYVEAGAFHAIGSSNSLFFEVNRGWTGLLVEPVSEFYQQILLYDRSAFVLNACLAKRKPMVAKFRLDWWGSGRES